MIQTYEELKAAIKNWLHRDDLDARIPEFISLGESAINRMLRVREMETKSTVTFSTVTAPLPAGYMEMIAFSDDLGVPLVAVSADELNSNIVGKPHYYRVSSVIEFDRTPDTEYTFNLRYYKRLDIENEVNAVLLNHPDIYLYAALLSAEPYLKNDQRITTWKGLLDGLITDAHWQAQRNKNTLKTDVSVIGSFNITTG